MSLAADMDPAPLVWTDLYGAAHALWTGLPGGHRWLLSVAPEQAETVAAQLPKVFKGELHLLIGAYLTPLEATLREWNPRGLVVVDRALSGGPALEMPPHTVQLDGFSFTDGGSFPAWTSALPVQAPEGECAWAGMAAALEVPVVCCDPEGVSATLRDWWVHVPHASVPEVPQRQAVQR